MRALAIAAAFMALAAAQGWIVGSTARDLIAELFAPVTAALAAVNP